MAFNDITKIGITEVRYTIAYLTGKSITNDKAELILSTLDGTETNMDGEDVAPVESFMEHLQRFYPTETLRMKFDCTTPTESMKKVSDWVDRYYGEASEEVLLA